MEPYYLIYTLHTSRRKQCYGRRREKTANRRRREKKPTCQCMQMEYSITVYVRGNRMQFDDGCHSLFFFCSLDYDERDKSP